MKRLVQSAVLISLLYLVTSVVYLSGCKAPTQNLTRAGHSSVHSAMLESAATQPQVAPPEKPQFIYVNGWVMKPGRYAWTNGMTLKDGIQAAGGFKADADRRLRLMHRDRSFEEYRLGRDRRIPSTADWTLMDNPPLRPEDLIFIRRREVFQW